MEEKEKKRLRFPIRLKTIFMVVIFGLVIAEIAMIYFSTVSSNNNKRNYKQLATDLSNTVALSLDVDKVKDIADQAKSYYDAYDPKPTREEEGTPAYASYMAQFKQLRVNPNYIEIQNYLKSVKDVNMDTEAIYLAFVDYTNKKAIYIVYDQENELYPSGIVDPLYEEDYPLCDNPKLGFVASIYDSEIEGMTLVTAGAPIVDSNDDVICYALVDISFNNVKSKQADSIIRLFIYLLVTVIGLSMIAMAIVHFTLIKPVKTLQNAAKSYDVNNPEGTHKIFSSLKVNTSDEFYDLAINMKKMENDINTRINELVTVNEELVNSQRVAQKMTELANKDALTGVKNKGLYQKAVDMLNEKIKNHEKVEFGFAMIDLNYLKMINDDYGHNNGDAAIIKLCNLICTIFAHSPVYRIGGDEFAVLLRNRDYNNAEELVDEFNKKIDGLWEDKDLALYERISAAIGIAKYDPNIDKSAEDVFKRADRNMYDRKWIMKSNNSW